MNHRLFWLWMGLCLVAETVLGQAPPSIDLAPPRPIRPPVEVASTPASSLTLVDLEEMALHGNPSLAQASARVEAARGNMVQVGLWPNPHIGYSGQQLGSGGKAEQHGLFVGQEIIRGGKLSLSADVAAQEIVKAEQQWSAQRFRVLTDVRMSFYEVLIAQRRVELTSQLVELGTSSVKAAEALLKAMEVTQVDVLQATIEVDTARLAAQNAQNRHLAAWRHLTSVVAQPGLPMTRLQGEMDAEKFKLDWDSTLTGLLSLSPELAEAHAEVERARWAVARAEAEPIPNLNVQTIFQSDAGTGSADGVLQLTMPIPVYNRNQGAIRQAYAELMAAQRGVERMELALRRRLATVFERYANARQQYELYSRQILPNAKSQMELVAKAYGGGEVGYTNLLVAQRTYFQTNLAYVEALRELWLSIAEIDGMLLSDSLQSGR